MESNKQKIINEAALTRWRLILGKKAEDYGVKFGSQNDNMNSDSKTTKIPKHTKEKKKPPQIPKQSKAGSNTKSQGNYSTSRSNKPIKISSDYANKGTIKKAQNRNNSDMEQIKQIDSTLNLVYETSSNERSAGRESSRLSIPKWIENVTNFFPKNTKEVLEKDLVEKSDLKDIIDNPELFEKVEPSIEMVKTIISMKHLLPEDIKNVARLVVKKVVDELKSKLKDGVERHIIGAIKRDRHTPIKVFRNIDWKDSIRKNLKHYDPNIRKLIMAEPRFYSAEKKKKPWQIVVLVDESGSMSDSVIYSIVMASIFSTLPAVHTNLIIFDTQVVDLSHKIADPVDVLMSVQLGGGTDITKAVSYGQSLIKNPKKCIMVIISDFYEGRPYPDLDKAIKHILEGQTKILGIASLGSDSQPMYNRKYAKKLNKMGIDVLACTPEKLPKLIARLMK